MGLIPGITDVKSQVKEASKVFNEIQKNLVEIREAVNILHKDQLELNKKMELIAKKLGVEKEFKKLEK